MPRTDDGSEDVLEPGHRENADATGLDTGTRSPAHGRVGGCLITSTSLFTDAQHREDTGIGAHPARHEAATASSRNEKVARYLHRALRDLMGLAWGVRTLSPLYVALST